MLQDDVTRCRGMTDCAYRLTPPNRTPLRSAISFHRMLDGKPGYDCCAHKSLKNLHQFKRMPHKVSGELFCALTCTSARHLHFVSRHPLGNY
jgi:hypothetical protein